VALDGRRRVRRRCQLEDVEVAGQVKEAGSASWHLAVWDGAAGARALGCRELSHSARWDSTLAQVRWGSRRRRGSWLPSLEASLGPGQRQRVRTEGSADGGGRDAQGWAGVGIFF
jgi:hypothetical protein